jgi:hypothetical protein
MIQLPRLVHEIIGWYQWKAKISECNKEYHRIVYELLSDTYTVNFHINRPFIFDQTQIFQYRKSDNINIRSSFIYNFTCYGETNVAILPEKYYFTSGINNPQGYTTIYGNNKICSKRRKVNRSIPNIIFLN